MAAPQASSRLEMLQARFQQKQLQEKEQKLLQLYDQQQQRAYQVVQRSSAGSNASNQGSTSVRTTTSTSSQGGKVRQMFDERRQTTVKGIDRSYPLEPLENKLRKQTNANGATATQRNGNLGVNRQSVSMKRMARADVNSNLNGGKPVVSYHEEITRESFEPFVRHQDDEDEFGVENRVANGHHRHDADELDETFDQDAIERNRLMAKIHLMGFDETLKHRVRNDLESEEFPEYLMVDVPDKLPKKNITKKLSQAQARLERFKNTIAKKNSVPKQSISTSTVIKKRSEQMEPARSNSQGNEIAGTYPSSARSRTWERSQRILANVKNPPLAETRMVDEMSKGRRKSSDVQTRSERDAWKTSSKQISSRPRTCPASNEFKSLTSDGKIFIRRSPNPRVSRAKSNGSDTAMSADRRDIDSKSTSADRRSASPQFFHRENERSATTMSIDRETIDESKSWSEWASEVHGKRNTDPRYFDITPQQSPTITNKVSGAKSPEWEMRSSSKGSTSPPFFLRSAAATSIGGSAARLESLDWGEKIFAKAEAIPQDSSQQYERSETSTSIDRRSDLSESPLFYRETKQKANPRFFLHEFDQSPRTDKFNSSTWNKETLRRDMNPLPRYFHNEFKQIGKTDDVDRKSTETRSLKRNKEMGAKQNVQYFDKKHRESNSVDRKTTVPSKSPLYEESILKRRSTNPRYFCKESKRSATTMTIDHATSESGSPLYDRKAITKRSSSPQFIRKQSERSATTVSIDRKINEPKSLPHDRKMLTKRNESPQFFNRKPDKQQYATADIDKYDRLKPKIATTRYDMRTTSPQFFCKETDKSATTMLIEPKSSAASTAKYRRISEQESDYSNTYKSLVKPSSSINKKMSPAQRRYIWDPSIAEREMKRNLKENEISATEMTRRSSRATSDSSVANLKYGLEFNSVFQSAELVREFMKSREQRPSPPKRNIKNANALSTKDVQSKNRHGTPLFGQKTKSTSPSRLEIKDERKSATPESPRKSITPIEVDVEIQEIIMTDHRIERDRALQNVASPISKRQTDGTFTKSSGGKTKFDTSITYPVRKTHRQRASILGPSVFKKESSSEKSRNRKGSTLSLSMLDNRKNETSRRVIARAEEDRENDAKMSKTWSRSTKDDHKTEYGSTPKKQHEDRQHSRSPIQMQSDTDNTRRSTKMMSSDLIKREQHSAISQILRENSRYNRQEIQSPRLMRDTLKDSSPSIIEQDQRESENKQGNRTVDEVDAGIDAKYQTIVETALNRTIKNRRKIIGPANSIRNKDIQLRKGPRATMKSITAKKIISPKKSGKQHDIKTSALSQTLSSKQTPKIARDTDISEISVLQKVVSKADRSSSPKFRTYTIKNSKYQTGTSHVKETTGSSDKMNVKYGIEKSDNTNNTKGIPKAPVQREHKSENDFGRMDSVESALKRFDSIGAEFDHSDLAGFRVSPDISLQTMNVQMEVRAKTPIISPESTVDSREVTEDLAILKPASKCALDKGIKIKNDFMRKSDLKILRKETHFPKGLAKSKSLTGSKQRSMQTRSPMCKRQLFPSEKEISKNQLKRSHAKAHRKENDRSANVAFRECKMSSKTTSLEREVTKKSKRLVETPGISVKPLRSIEDIRKSIDKLTAVKESRPAIANRQSASREGVDTKGSISATDAAKNVFSGGNPTRLTKVKSCVSRITKNPSPDVAARKQHETNAARTTRRHVLSSPSKSPDISSKNQETKSSRKSVIAKGGDSIGSKTATVDVVDAGLQNGSLHESSTKKSDAFVIDLDDQPSKESDAMPSKKPPVRKSSSDQITSRGLGRPISSSSSSANSSQSQASNTKTRMATKFSSPSGPQIKKTFSAKSSGSSMDNLVSCSICKRNFSQDRINYHETICAKTTSKKRKQFNTKVFRVRGTELEPFVKEGFDKKQELKMKKPEVKSNWRRKHEDFINAIRYAKQVQAHVAAGGNPNDIPPPPSSDTSDYIQCPHCGRKFNQMAAERHIPKCENMRHNKPAFSRAPRPRR